MRSGQIYIGALKTLRTVKHTAVPMTKGQTHTQTHIIDHMPTQAVASVNFAVTLTWNQ